MNWVILVIAGLFEVLFTYCLGRAKETSGNEAFWWYGGFVLSLGISISLLVRATQNLPVGTAYAIWTGIGAVGTVLLGILFFKEPADFWRILFLCMLIISLVGLKYVSHV